MAQRRGDSNHQAELSRAGGAEERLPPCAALPDCFFMPWRASLPP